MAVTTQLQGRQAARMQGKNTEYLDPGCDEEIPSIAEGIRGGSEGVVSTESERPADADTIPEDCGEVGVNLACYAYACSSAAIADMRSTNTRKVAVF
jgi:hypothetical protein